MSEIEYYPQSNNSPRAGYYPDHPRVVELNRMADGITELVAHLDAGTFQLLELICEFDKNQGWSGPGINSCAHWLNWKCGMSMGSARERVRVARALPCLPEISANFREGRVSYSKVRAMTRVATPKNEKKLLQIALHGTASHVETQVRLYRKTKRIEALTEENLRHGHRQLSWYIDDDDYWVFKGRFTPEQGALLQKALEAAGDQLFEEQQCVPEDVTREVSDNVPLDRTTPEPISQKRADELARVVEGFLAGVKMINRAATATWSTFTPKSTHSKRMALVQSQRLKIVVTFPLKRHVVWPVTAPWFTGMRVKRASHWILVVKAGQFRPLSGGL